MNRIRIGSHAAGHKTENGPVAEEPWHEGVGSDECPWPDTEQEPTQD